MKEGREFWRFCSRNWRGPSGPLIIRRLHVWQIAQKTLFAKSSVAWLASMAMVGCGGVRSACDASGKCRSEVVLPNGLPVQVKPTYSEPGLPAFSFPTSCGSLLGGSTGSVDTGNGGGDGSTSAGSGSSGGSGDAYNTMMGQRWGSAAANAAGAMGVSATALAAIVCHGVKLPECGSVRGRHCVWRVPDDQLDLHRGHQRRPGV
jgi:hypothetical protein